MADPLPKQGRQQKFKNTVLFFTVISLFTFLINSTVYGATDVSHFQVTDLEQQIPDYLLQDDLKPKVITIIFNNDKVTHLTYAETIQECIYELDFKDTTYEIKGNPSDNLMDGSRIYLSKITESTYEIEEAIEFTIEYIENPALSIGVQNIQQQGSEGQLVRVYKEIYKDGDLDSEELISQEVFTEPINTIIEVGTKTVYVAPMEVLGAGNSCIEWSNYVDTLTSDQTERDWMKFIMYRESGCNAGNNSNSLYKGLFQYHPTTYANLGGVNIWDGYEQVELTLMKYRSGGANQWYHNNQEFIRLYGE